jgi:hypothetical protein
MYPTKAMLTTTGILSLLFMMTSSSIFTNPALAQPTLATGSSSSIGGSAMYFGSMNLVNDIMNSSSISATLGMSTVKGVKVTGINLLQNNEASVALRQIITSSGNTSLPGSVTVIALRLPMNLADLMSMAASSSAAAAATTSNKTASGGSNTMGMMGSSGMQGYGGKGAAGNPTSPFMNTQLAFLKNIQIGSSSILNADWSQPQSVTIGLVGMGSGGSISSNKSSSAPSPKTADFIMVIVIPFTGKTNLSK